MKFNCCPSERNLSLSKRCRAGKQEAYQIVIKTNFCISSWAFWLTVVCHMKNIIIKIFLVFCRFGADTTTKRLQWVGTIISTLTTNTWFVITTHTQLSQQLIHRCGYTEAEEETRGAVSLSLYCCWFPVILITNTIYDRWYHWNWLPTWHAIIITCACLAEPQPQVRGQWRGPPLAVLIHTVECKIVGPLNHWWGNFAELQIFEVKFQGRPIVKIPGVA